ncbi:ester cyclase [Streptomyces sp. NPDC057381]|uniref:ester cyclase n=1 Tax=unclassified Streptomyces TaxID=2593676 RepID=UPI00362623EB
MSTAQEAGNKAAFTRVLDASNSHDEQLMRKTIGEVFHPDVRMATALPLGATGVEAVREVFTTLHRAFPDLRIKAEDLIAKDDKVVARQTVTGTHQGEYMGLPPTGRPVTYREIFILRFAAGRIVEVWGVVDVHSQMKQLHAVWP